jgi:hypothetical protein
MENKAADADKAAASADHQFQVAKGQGNESRTE